MKICGAVLIIVIILGIAGLRKKALIFFIILLAAGFCFIVSALNECSFTKIEDGYIKKNEAGKGSINKELIAVTENEKIDISVNIPERKYTQEEIEKILKREKELLTKEMLGENDSFDEIRYDLCLKSAVENEAVSVYWYSSDPEIISSDGKLQKNIPKYGANVTVTAVLSIDDTEERVFQELTVYPKNPTGNIKEDIENSIDENEDGEKVLLPEKIDGRKVEWYEKKSSSASAVSVLVLTAGILLYLSERQKDEERKKERAKKLKSEYPEFVSRIVLLMYSGLSLRNVFLRIAADYKNRKNTNKKTQIYEEAVLVCRDIENGMTQTEAFEKMAYRCGINEYRNLSMILIRSQKHGAEGITESLEEETMNAYSEKKRNAQIRGNAASIKMLLPLGMMLLVVFAVILIPAFFTV